MVLYAPSFSSIVLILTGFVAFAAACWLRPENWYRRMAASCIGSGIAIAAAPVLDIAVGFSGRHFGHLLVGGGGRWLAGLLVVAGMFFALLDYLLRRPVPASRRPPSEDALAAIVVVIVFVVLVSAFVAAAAIVLLILGPLTWRMGGGGGGPFGGGRTYSLSGSWWLAIGESLIALSLLGLGARHLATHRTPR